MVLLGACKYLACAIGAQQAKAFSFPDAHGQVSACHPLRVAVLQAYMLPMMILFNKCVFRWKMLCIPRCVQQIDKGIAEGL